MDDSGSIGTSSACKEKGATRKLRLSKKNYLTLDNRYTFPAKFK